MRWRRVAVVAVTRPRLSTRLSRLVASGRLHSAGGVSSRVSESVGAPCPRQRPSGSGRNPGVAEGRFVRFYFIFLTFNLVEVGLFLFFMDGLHC